MKGQADTPGASIFQCFKCCFFIFNYVHTGGVHTGGWESRRPEGSDALNHLSRPCPSGLDPCIQLLHSRVSSRRQHARSIRGTLKNKQPSRGLHTGVAQGCDPSPGEDEARGLSFPGMSGPHTLGDPVTKRQSLSSLLGIWIRTNCCYF